MPKTTLSTKTPTQPATEAKPTNRPAPIEPTGLQDQIAELAADMILNGGRAEHVENLLYAVAGHSCDLHFDGWPYDPKERDDAETKWLNTFVPRWRDELIKTWPAKPREKEEPLPKTVTEKVRQNLRSRLRGEFEDFIGGGTPEELKLLYEILNMWVSISSAYDYNRIYIAEAFADAIGEHRVYIKAPEALADLLEKQVEAFQKQGQRRVA